MNISYKESKSKKIFFEGEGEGWGGGYRVSEFFL